MRLHCVAVLAAALAMLAAPADGQELSRAEQFARIPPPVVRVVRCEALAAKAWDAALSPDESKLAFIKLDEPDDVGAERERFPGGAARRAETGNEEDYSSHVWLLDLAANRSKRLTEGQGKRRFPAFDPAGQRIMFVQDAGDLWLVNADGGGLTRLPVEAKCSWGPPVWSPDGRTIAFTVRGRGVCLFDLEAKREVIVPAPQGAEDSLVTGLRWARDSRRLYGLYQKALWRLDAAEGKFQKVAEAWNYSLSPDGRLAALPRKVPEKPEAGRLELLDLESGKTVATVDLPGVWLGQDFAWSADGSKILTGGALIDVDRTRKGLPEAAARLRGSVHSVKALLRDGRFVTEAEEAVSAMAVSGAERLRRVRIRLYYLDWNAAFLSREKVREMLAAAADRVVAAVEPKNAAKLAQPAEKVSAPTRVIATAVLDGLYDRMLRLAMNKYREELRTVIEYPDRYDYCDPLVDGAGWGFLRRAKSLVSLQGEIVRLEVGESQVAPGAVEVSRLWGYPVVVEEQNHDGRRTAQVRYTSEAQNVTVRFDLSGSDDLRRDTREALLAELDPLFALELLYDGDRVYGIPFDGWRDTIVERVRACEAEALRQRAQWDEPPLPAEVGWPMWRRDPANSGVSQVRLKLPLEEKWRRALEGSPGWSTPVADDRYIYVCRRLNDKEGGVFVLDRRTGEVAKRIDVWGRFDSTPLVTARRLFVLAEPRRVLAFEKGAWNSPWTTCLPGNRSESPLAMAGGLLLACSRAGYLHALDPHDGRIVWKEAVSDVHTAPLIIRGLIVYPNRVGRGWALVARQAETGQVVWEHRFADGEAVAYHDTLCTDGQRVFVFTNSQAEGAACGHLRAVELVAGQQVWAQQFDRPYGFPYVLADGHVLVQTDQEHLVAVEAATGALRWTAEIPPGRAIPPIVAGRHLVGLAGADLYVLDLQERKTVQTLRLPQPAGIQSAVLCDDDGVVYVVNGDDGWVLALE